MNQLDWRERRIAIAFIVLWLPAFVMTIVACVSHVAYAPLLVQSSGQPAGPPIVTGFVPRMRGAESGLRAGDALLSVNGIDLAGTGPFGWKSAVARFHGKDTVLEIVYRRDGTQSTTRVVAGSYAMYWPRVVASLVFACSVLILLFRVRASALVRSLAITYACGALFFACTFGGGIVHPAWPLAVQLGSLAVGVPMALRSALLFPSGLIPQGNLARFGPWIFLFLAPLDASRFYGLPLSPRVGALVGGLLLVVYLVSCVVVLMRSYRSSDAIARRRIKWFLIGVYWAVLPPVATAILAAVD